MSQLQHLTSTSKNGSFFTLNDSHAIEKTSGLPSGFELKNKKNLYKSEEIYIKTEFYNPNNFNRFELVENQTEKLVTKAEPKNYVEGIVLSVDGVVVLCSLKIDNSQLVEVELPRVLFPKDIEFGSAISLEMLEENGIRKPYVSIRKFDNPEKSELVDRLETMIQAL